MVKKIVAKAIAPAKKKWEDAQHKEQWAFIARGNVHFRNAGALKAENTALKKRLERTEDEVRVLCSCLDTERRDKCWHARDAHMHRQELEKLRRARRPLKR